MRPQLVWQGNAKFIEVGVRQSDLAHSLQNEGYANYLGVSGNKRHIARLQRKHSDLGDRLTYSKRDRLVRNNNANVLLLSGIHALHLWKYRSVRHADYVAWRLGPNLTFLLALLGCLWHMTSKSYTWPRIVTLKNANQKVTRLLVSRILRPRLCNRNSLHFIPHILGLKGFFGKLDRRQVNYVVLRWFESLPHMEPDEDVDLLVADESWSQLFEILHSAPGIIPCDVYSETGLSRSDYMGTPYYPAPVANRILAGAVRHRDLCYTPNPCDYFHSLAYHAVYHKGTRSNLDRGQTGLAARGKPTHDYTGALRDMAAALKIQITLSLEGLHTYLQENEWGPSPEMLARLSTACRGNQWLRLLSQRLEPHVHDQGLAVFVLRQEAVKRGFQNKILAMLNECGFAILMTKTLSSGEVEYSAPRTRGGNWQIGPFDISGGPPAIAVVAYDSNPLTPTRRQRKKFPQRTNARLFAKEHIRDVIIKELPRGQSFNAIHSSDHAAEAWHLLELYAPEIMDPARERLQKKGCLSAAPLPAKAA